MTTKLTVYLYQLLNVYYYYYLFYYYLEQISKEKSSAQWCKIFRFLLF